MGVKHLFLALLSQKNMHGYELKSSFEELVSKQWPLNFGQVYTTLTRLERDGLLKWEDVHQGDKPDKKVYFITDKGRETFIEWLNDKPDWNLYPDEMAFKFATFKLVGRDTSKELLNQYRTFLLQMLKHLISIKDKAEKENITQFLIIERNILRAEADLKWIEICNERWGDIE